MSKGSHIRSYDTEKNWPTPKNLVKTNQGLKVVLTVQLRILKKEN